MAYREVLERLKGIDWETLGAKAVVLYGSLARGKTSPNDIDLYVIVEPTRDVLEAVADIAEAVEKATGMKPDIHVVSSLDNVDCFLALEAAAGMVVFATLEGRVELVKIISFCNDFMLSRKKVRYVETLMKRVKGRMILEKLPKTISEHAVLLDGAAERGVDWNDRIQAYGIIHALQVQAQAAIDYLLHVCALLGLAARTPIDCTRKLQEHHLLEALEAEFLRRLIGFRNIVVHEYAEVDYSIARKILEEKQYRRTLTVIAKLHEKLMEQGYSDP